MFITRTLYFLFFFTEDAAFLPDITNILTSNGDGHVKVWDVTSGEILHRFTGHKGRVNQLSLCPSGDLFVSGSEDGAVKIWDLGNFQADPVYHENRHKILSKLLSVAQCGNFRNFLPLRNSVESISWIFCIF